MEIDENLLEELSALRTELKEKLQKKHKVFNCSDQTLQEIAKFKPTKISDFEGISGVGPVFIENYAQYFIQIVKNYNESDESSVKLDKKGVHVLQEYEKKLVNLNKRNHLLYCPKLYNKYGVDLFNSQNDIRNIVLGSARGLTVAKADSPLYSPIVSLLRANNRNLREKGQNNLFVAYPFVKGQFSGEGFNIRAPLALFPIKEEKTANGIKLAVDNSRDVLYNPTLLLANFKFNNINKSLPDIEIESRERETFIENLLEFYKENKIDIKNPEEEAELHVFEAYSAETFPSFKKGEFVLENSAVLGIFPICSSSIQKDFQAITESRKINKLLDDLLSNKAIEDDESEASNNSVSEKDICYINDLDAAQERVLATLKNTDELVVQGPPGTGKSQTITSLIADFVSQEKSVLLVSEKKTALDVVYSRLGNLSKYALILDDVNNKEIFYSQLQKMATLKVSETETVSENESKTEELSKLEIKEAEIEEKFGSLQEIADLFYKKDEFGIEPYKLYLISNVKQILEKDNLRRLRKVSELLRDDCKLYTYPDIAASYDYYSNLENLSKVAEFKDLVANYFWLLQMKKNLTEFELQEMEIDFEKVLDAFENRKELKFIKKVFGKNEPMQEIKSLLEKYFDVKRKFKLKNYFYKNFEKLEDGSKHYPRFRELEDIYNTIPEITQKYYSSMEKLQPLCEEESADSSEDVNPKIAALKIANDLMLKYLPAKHLRELEIKNRDKIPNLEKFTAIISEISKDMEEKRALEKVEVSKLLDENIKTLSHSKRHSEILKQIEAKRKWSVNKFVQKYNFELFKSIKIWLLTPEVVSELLPLETGLFDLVVFDEASQMYVEKGIPSILRGKKVVIAGDHKQLRPSSLGEGRFQLNEDDIPEDEELSVSVDEDSLLDLARFKYNQVMLNFHYRSNFEELIAFSNYAFYNANLYVSPNNKTPENPPIQVHKMQDGLWTKRANEAEAKYIVNLLKDFFKNRKNNETVGIITFNTNQRDKIDDLIDKECAVDSEFAKAIQEEIGRKKDGEDIGLFVKNIETVQGDERDVIIFSMGYAKNEEGKFIQNFGWLNQSGGENRLNVAISRAKKQIHIVVSFEPSELKIEKNKNNGPAILKKYLEYAFAVSDNNKELAKNCLESMIDKELDEKPSGEAETGAIEISEKSAEDKYQTGQTDFEKEIYDYLCQKASEYDYEVEKNVGIGGYSIDFALRRNGDYILGLECDSKLYKNGLSSRERDFYRQKYLEGRGWKIYRVWSILWKKNPQRVMEKIEAVIAKA